MKAFVNGNTAFPLVEKEGNLIPEDDRSAFDIVAVDKHTLHILKNGQGYTAELLEQDHDTKTLKVKIDGGVYEVTLKEPLEELMEKMGLSSAAGSIAKDIKAPMPGQIVQVCIEEGSEIQKGDIVLILKAMKMENTIKAAGSGRVDKVMINEGDSVEKNQVLITME